MHQIWLFVPALLFLLAVTTQKALGSGDLLGISDYDCYGKAPQSATFTAQKNTYVFTGKCGLLHTRLNLSTTAPWTGTGTYEPATGRTTEDIVVPAARMDEPSRPYGRFQATMHCIADPWLTTKLTCDNIVSTADAPLDRTKAANAIGWRQPFPLAPIITNKIQDYGRPYSSILNDDVRKALNVQYQNRLGLQTKVNPQVRQSTAPTIISPAANVRVISTDLKVQIVPRNFTGTHILVQFTKLNVPAGYLTPTYAWTKSVNELANGVNLPADIFTSNQAGSWSIRARIDLPKPGEFSADVPFTFAPAPLATPKKLSPYMQR